MALKHVLPVLLLSFFVLMAVLDTCEATYRKPPFNGSIFGKRNSDYDTSGKALSALCEIALESCQSWFPQDKK